MRTIVVLLAALAVIGAGCSSDSGEDADAGTTAVAETTPTTLASENSTTSEAPSAETTTTLAATDSTSSTTTAPPVEIDGPPAPDFTMELDGGAEFTLSAEQKPVYMIFWAEW